VLEIIQKIKENVHKDFILSAKINGADSLFRGLSIGDALLSAQMMEAAGLDWLEVSGGMAEAKDVTVKPDIGKKSDEGYFRLHGAEIRQAVEIPVASVGGYRSLSVMENTVSSGDADLISMSRPFVREPDLVNKFKSRASGRADCISCNRCFNPRGLRCWHLKEK
jgi:2,4-dienoyl-CoA reductase-like NADH-dependent reductase (Old Yellow Enzyme family)